MSQQHDIDRFADGHDYSDDPYIDVPPPDDHHHAKASQAGQKLDRLRTIAKTTDELADLKPPTPIVDGLLYEQSLAMLYGPSGVGKSFVAIDLAMHIASDATSWHGRPIARGPVLYIAAEGAAGVRLRTDAWRAHHNLTDSVTWLPHAINLFDPSWAEPVAQYAKEIGAVLIEVDTLARSVVGANENSAQDMGVVIDNFTHLVTTSGAAVLNIHHSGKNSESGERGSSALKGAMDTQLYLEGSTRKIVTLTNPKQKDAEQASKMAFRFHPVAGTDSGILLPAGESYQPQRMDPAEAKVLEATRHVIGAWRNRRDKDRSPWTKTEWIERTAGTDKSNRVAFARLVDAGTIVPDDPDSTGRGSRWKLAQRQMDTPSGDEK